MIVPCRWIRVGAQDALDQEAGVYVHLADVLEGLDKLDPADVRAGLEGIFDDAKASQTNCWIFTS